MTFDGQVDADLVAHLVPIGNRLQLRLACYPNTDATVRVEAHSPGLGFYGWGLRSDGSTVRPAVLSSGGTNVQSGRAPAAGVYLGVVAAATPPGQDVRYVRVDVSAIAGNKCNYHALVTPS